MDAAPPLKIKNVVLDGDRATIHCEQGRISAIERGGGVPGEGGPGPEGGPTSHPKTADENAQAGPHPAAEVLDGRGCVAHPPLINAHTHAAMTLFRGNGDDLPLMEWLEKRVWPYERRLTAEDVYAGTRLAILEMIRSGTVFFNDMYWDFAAAAAAVEEMGVRACLSRVLIDFGSSKTADSMRREIEHTHADASALSNRVSHALGPHSIYTVSEASLRWAAGFAREKGLLVHIHVSETEHEVEQCVERHGCTPVEYLDRLGILSERTIAAHTVWLSDSDIALLGERRAVCVHNPVANMKLAVGGVYPHRKLARAGAVCAIGTDGAGSNNNLDLFEELKVAALLQKFHDDDATSLPASEALDMAIANPAEAFGLAGPDLEPGRDADLILIDTSRAQMEPLHSLTSNLVYSAHGDVVDSVVCAGRVLMRHREVEGEGEIVAAAREAASRLFADG
jgi:5-methylthioadenosine/S-adenosylhomocysteine deaminase